MINDIKILRDLAAQYALFASEDINKERLELYKGVNDLKQIRPVVLIDEIPWNEFKPNDELNLICEDKFLSSIEWFFRSNIFKWKYMPADMILSPYFPVQKKIKVNTRIKGKNSSSKER